MENVVYIIYYYKRTKICRTLSHITTELYRLCHKQRGEAPSSTVCLSLLFLKFQPDPANFVFVATDDFHDCCCWVVTLK